MLKRNDDRLGRGTVGIAVEDGALSHTMARILSILGRYQVAIFEEEEVNGGYWPDLAYAAVIASPGALHNRQLSRPGRCSALPTVILAVRRASLADHLSVLAEADAFVLTDETLTRLPSLIPLSAHGLSIMPHAKANSTLEVSPRLSQLKSLSTRDLQVLRELSRGRGNQAIAQRLGMSLPMAKVHIRRIVDRLGFRNRTDAAVFAATVLALDFPAHTHLANRSARRG